jgi:ubiquinone/menaquinone biosynthesis C-methylase UbiE
MGDLEKQGYWHRESSKFAAFYEKQKQFSPKALVSRFLEARTTHLVSLVEIGPHDTVLDVGCGSGVHIRLFSPMCREIVGVDYSTDMISTARARLSELPEKNWRVGVADGHNLPFADASFDWIISMGLLDYVSSPERVLQECYRVLRDPGHIVFTMPKKPSLFSFLRTSFGTVLRRKLFDLPQVANAVSSTELDGLLGPLKFHVRSADSIWTAMWIVKASKTKS